MGGECRRHEGDENRVQILSQGNQKERDRSERLRCILKDNIKMGLNTMSVNNIKFDSEYKWRAGVNAAVNLRHAQNTPPPQKKKNLD
jgi:hypothetical protein